MRTAFEIVELRKHGDYMTSYEEALKVKSEDPYCIWVYNHIGWCLFDMMKANASVQHSDEFLMRLQEFADLNKERQLDGMLLNNVVWPVRTFVTNCITKEMVFGDMLYRTFAILQQINFDPQNENYGILLGAFVRAKKWSGLKEFIDWWNLDNIKEKDCETYRTDARVSIMSIAERAYIAYSGILLGMVQENKVAQDEVASFIAKLDAFAENYPKFQYPRYFQAKLLLSIGRKEEAQKALLPFVKTKSRDYWVWDTLGDAFDDEDLRLSCYCKALTCFAKDTFLRKMHFKLCDILLRKKMYDEAGTELKVAIEISKKNGWSVPFEYRDYVEEQWYQQATKLDSNKDLYLQNCYEAEQLIYSDYHETAVVIIGINEKARFANFITEDRKIGFFSYKYLPKKVKLSIGSIYLCRLELVNDERYNIYTCKTSNSNDYEGRLTKEYKGQLSIKTGGFGIVDDVFMPSFMAKNLSDGDIISGIAIPSFDKRKNKWGWRVGTYEKEAQ